MSTQRWGTRAKTPVDNDISPEDARVGETLRYYMERRVIQSPSGYLVRHPVTQEELAKAIWTPKCPNGVSRQYVSRLCCGSLHMSNEVLFSIAKFFDIEPIAIKRPDPEYGQQRLPIAVAA